MRISYFFSNLLQAVRFLSLNESNFEEAKLTVSGFIQEEVRAALSKAFSGLFFTFIMMFSLVSITWQIGLIILPSPNGTMVYISFLGLLFLGGAIGLALIFRQRVEEEKRVPVKEMRSLAQIGLAGFSLGFIEGYLGEKERRPDQTPGIGYSAHGDIPVKSERNFL